MSKIDAPNPAPNFLKPEPETEKSAPEVKKTTEADPKGQSEAAKNKGAALVDKAKDALPKSKETPQERAAFRDLKIALSKTVEGLRFLGTSHSKEEVKKIIEDELQAELAKLPPETKNHCRELLRRRASAQHIRTFETLSGNPKEAFYVDITMGGNGTDKLNVETYSQNDKTKDTQLKLPWLKFRSRVTTALMALPKSQRTEAKFQEIMAQNMTEELKDQLKAAPNSQNHVITFQIPEDTSAMVDPYDANAKAPESWFDAYMYQNGKPVKRVPHYIKKD